MAPNPINLYGFVICYPYFATPPEKGRRRAAQLGVLCTRGKQEKENQGPARNTDFPVLEFRGPGYPWCERGRVGFRACFGCFRIALRTSI